MDFVEETYVKIVGTSGDFRYGYIEKIENGGFRLLVSLDEEGASALGYETESGAMAEDWAEMLSNREKAIIIGLAAGCSTKEIAFELSRSASTVRTHIRDLRLKLQLDNRIQLVAFSEGMAKSLQEKEE